MLTTVQEIVTAISQLTPEQFAVLRAWLAGHEAQHWDQQLAADAAAGRLDALAEEALGDLRATAHFCQKTTGTQVSGN